MASILKIPTEKSKGIVTFTSEERNKFILKDTSLQKRINNLKERWVFGLHHNWHDFKFSYNPLFDFSMAGATDLIELNNKKFAHLPIDCANFSPEYFKFSKENLMWDILYVGRAVHFKRIPEFLQVIRKLYDRKLMYRVLFIAPIPSECAENNPNKSFFCDIQDVYKKMFSSHERHYFNLLTIDYDYPFPFDIETLSHFYKSSRIFVFTSDDERRPRTVAYAMASGMPTVLMKSVASLLPEELQIRPFVFLADSFEDYPQLVQDAVSYTRSNAYTKQNMMGGINEFDSEQNLRKFQHFLYEKFQVDLFEHNKKYSCLNNLDIRLARHHGFGDNKNSIGWSLDSLLTYLENRTFSELKSDVKSDDIERDISNFHQYGEKTEVSMYKQKFIDRLKYGIRRIIGI